MSEILENISLKLRNRAMASKVLGPHLLNDALDAELESLPQGINLAEELELRRLAESKFFGFGKLQPLLDDETIEEIWVNQPNEVFVARAGQSVQMPISLSSLELESIIERMLRITGRRLDRSSPFVDAALPDGSRLHVVIPDITRSHWSINIRKFPNRVLSLSDLVSIGSMSFEQSQFLSGVIRNRANILVSGATQAGKTTLLCALLDAMDEHERLITVEDTFEIRSRHSDWVALQTRQSNLEGLGAVSLRRLIKEALRMRPSRLVVGEVREAEALDLLIALNSGIPGICTIHANSAEDALLKLATLPLLAGENIPSEFVQPTIAACIDYVVHCQMNSAGQRSISEIRTVFARDGQIASRVVTC